jgi:hypothetical protein
VRRLLALIHLASGFTFTCLPGHQLLVLEENAWSFALWEDFFWDSIVRIIYANLQLLSLLMSVGKLMLRTRISWDGTALHWIYTVICPTVVLTRLVSLLISH